ncbi:hypothetical protein GGTG_07661 [Gaeumannomyces tritici R3-111a-1]|uniref:Uncharacterized protein n=1 Tax=Gaeumannomyces tritici (strain R3-111a-1) TaxID=644352 RepID=J3P2B4_GAET3|nr:hypothetical protein GGTG_07661 [Gaeumannomyces tritici R3-111a-1]EJT73806.1 hypothetical protein GGTG_07661 [Gaeumannomyces tritici R3-111a-1]
MLISPCLQAKGSDSDRFFHELCHSSTAQAVAVFPRSPTSSRLPDLKLISSKLISSIGFPPDLHVDQPDSSYQTFHIKRPFLKVVGGFLNAHFKSPLPSFKNVYGYTAVGLVPSLYTMIPLSCRRGTHYRTPVDAGECSASICRALHRCGAPSAHTNLPY